MKRSHFLFFTILFTFCSCSKDEDNIYKGSVTIESTDDLVTYSNLLEGKTEISGSVLISGLENPDLSLFNNIQKIGQHMTIEQCELVDLSNFSNLEEIRSFWILFNQISSLDGFENIVSVEGVQIELNSPSLNIDAIQNINVSSFFILQGISSPIPFFPNIVEVGGIDLSNLSGITDFSFLPNLTTSSFRLFLGDSENVTSLNGLENLSSIEKLEVLKLEKLIDISSLGNIENGNEIEFRENTKLSDFCPLKSILTGGGVSFSASDNLDNPTEEEIIMNCL